MAKTIVITGAGSGLGRALARRFANDGEQVVLLGRTLEKLQTVVAEIGDRAMAVACDVRSPDSVREAFATIAERFPTIDVLINNAVMLVHGAVADSTDTDILDSFATNCVGPVLCSRAAIAMMKPGGHIFCVSSGAVDNNYPSLAIYASSKAGLERFASALSEEVQPLGIRVTTVRCGQMVEQVGNWDLDPKTAELMKQAIASGWDPSKRPSSSFASVTEAFRALLDLPADLAATSVTLKPRATQ